MAKGGRIEIPLSDFVAIRKSPEMQAFIAQETEALAQEADGLAGEEDAYRTDLAVGKTRVRGYIHPNSPAGYRAEAKTSPLMQIAARSPAKSRRV